MGCLYRSPSGNLQESVEQLDHIFQESTNMPYSHLLVTGDFNLPQINWDLGYSSASEKHPSHCFIDTVQNCCLFQHVRCPTRVKPGETLSLLDLVFTNEEGMIKNMNILPGLGMSDHVVLTFDLVTFSPPRSLSDETRTHTNFEKLATSLSHVDWSPMINMNLKECYGFFKAILEENINSSSVTLKPKPMKSLYVNREAWRLRKKKNRLWTIYCNTQDPLDHARFSRCRNDLRRLTRNLRREFERNLANKLKTNPKAF